MRSTVDDIVYDLEEVIGDMTDGQLRAKVNAEYDGGWVQFISDSEG